jgi:hypothetical protein
VCLHRVGAPVSTKALPWLGQENNGCSSISLNTEMTTLKSFGCSFMTNDYKTAWPELISKKLNLLHECYASPGAGNFKIYCDILANSYKNDGSVYLINWTWIDRFDFVNHLEQWQTLRPAETSQLEKFYYQNFHSQLCDMISNASYIVSATEHLQSLNCPYVMTYMDHNLLMPIDPDWHDPRYLEVLQQKLQKILVDFDGDNFLDWSRKNNYPISKTLHPLEDAHRAAADYWLPAVKKLL